MFAEVILPILKLFPLDYQITEKVEVGDLVVVNFRNKKITGIVWRIKESTECAKIKAIEHKLNYKVSLEFLAFLKKAADYYLTSYGSITKLTLPIEIFNCKLKNAHNNYDYNLNLAALSVAQEKAFIDIQKSQFTLLQGVTGSGKTEVYFHLAKEMVDVGKQVLILMPEIALTNQMISRFEKRFGFAPAIWTSSEKLSYKKQIFHDVLEGKVKILIGARSASFLPFPNLGLIIIDEEHESSYKQESGVLYNARDMSVLRAKMCNAKLLLVSATPSIESYNNAKNGKYILVTLPERYLAVLPKIHLINLKHNKPKSGRWISDILKDKIVEALEQKQQVLLFINRKGYAPLVLCNDCGYRFCCVNCSTWLVFHKSTNKLICHHCGYFNVLKSKCPECAVENSLTPCGPGIERIQEEVIANFPNAAICLLSRDHVDKSAEKLNDTITKITNHDFDIIIGTQLITKGLHFPDIGIVGVIDADIGFSGGDLRAMEKTFQLLHQVSGRAGREKFLGNVYLQTYYPQSKIMQLLQQNNYNDFIEKEIMERAGANMPPFVKMASLIISSSIEKNAIEATQMLARKKTIAQNIQVLGPAPASIARINKKYRYRFIILAPRNFNIQKHITNWLAGVKIKSTISVIIDIDPYNLM
jgi:primosomal protein N' (replication factor Y)